ncbi:FAD/NAD(P)-binding protein [Nocardiopsis sediminis]|uniref:FAD/NAD(P)-binding protein n=1 Tax=Nocardiopsis sediminis TaxID=1778267 RepID=A0ABV8FG24_9ACTN
MTGTAGTADAGAGTGTRGPEDPAAADGFDVVAVGAGPRGVALVERLAARVPDGDPPVRVALIDAVEIGAGATWRTDQSPLLLNNTYSAHTTIFTDPSTPMSGPVVPGPDLVEWARDPHAPLGRPAWVAEEAAAIEPWSYPSRRLQGVYYREQLARAASGGRVRVTGILGTATDVTAAAGGDRRTVRLADGREVTGTVVVLAQGMVQGARSARTTALVEAARAEGLVYVEPGMPAERDWDAVPAGETVLVAGLGANFFDVVALLTEGRGGRFEPAGDPGRPARLRYLPSGREPLLVAGSRRGLPYRSKAVYPDGFPPRYRPEIATPEWFAEVARTPLQDFRTAVWPRLAQEFAWAHLSTLLAHHPEALRPGTAAGPLRDRLAAAPAGDIDRIVADTVTDPRWHLAVERLDRPDPAGPLSAEDWDRWVAHYVDRELDTIHRPLEHPRNAVNRAMAVLRGHVARLVRSGAIEGRSVVRDVEGWFMPLGLALASGPPPGRTAQVLSLVDAGLLAFLGEDSAIEFDPGVPGEPAGAAGPAFTGRSAVRRPPVRARAFIETRMSKGKVSVTADPLLRSLLDSGRARLHSRPNADGTRTHDASIDVTPEGFHPVDADGAADERIVVLGIPAEGVQPGSAIGATPGVPSPLLAGADAAAAHVLALRHPAPLGSR